MSHVAFWKLRAPKTYGIIYISKFHILTVQQSSTSTSLNIIHCKGLSAILFPVSVGCEEQCLVIISRPTPYNNLPPTSCDIQS